MDNYKSLLIVGLKTASMVYVKNVLVDVQLLFNEGSIPVTSGQWNPVIANVDGKNVYSITIYNIADNVKEKINNENVDIQLDNGKPAIRINNVKLNYVRNDIKFKTENYIKYKEQY